MAMASLYPPSPAEAPDDLTIPSFEFKTHALLVLVSLALFFVLYFGMILFCAAYSLWAAWFLLFGNAFAELFVVRLFPMAFVPPCAMLFILLVKNLFKIEHAKKDSLIEIFEDKHPRLFDFINQLCADVGSDRPTHVYVNYDVNAGAMLDTTSFFHLFLPTRRSLLIGLGLVNAINLTEFKALLAHEFGHFSQRSTKITAYVYTVRRIVYHVILGEDFVDQFIIAWSQLHPIIAWPAYLARGIQWLLRQGLFLIFYVICFFDFALSRQMEFNADLIAVSVTGSDAPVHLLFRTSFADACFDQAANDLGAARDYHLFTRDVFHHQSEAARILRKIKKTPRLGEPPALPTEPHQSSEVFEEDDDELARMWRTHPSSHDRERNAKARYIRTTFDERSPWILFDNVEELRERVTLKFYQAHLKLPNGVLLADPLKVQGFIDDEHADRTYDPRYQGLYDCRRLLLKANIQELVQEGAKHPASLIELVEVHQTLYSAEVKHRTQIYYKHWDEFHLLDAVCNGWHRPKNDELEFRGDLHDADEAERLLKKVEKEIDEDHQWLESLDRKVFLTYFQMAQHIDQKVSEELYCRYHFHLELQNIWRELEKNDRPISAALAFLQAQPSAEIPPHHLRKMLDIFRDAHQAMKSMLNAAAQMKLPALKNLPAGQVLQPFLLEKRLIEGLSKHDRTLTRRWINKLMNQYREMKNKVDRIHFKSLAGILALQERIGEECMRR